MIADIKDRIAGPLSVAECETLAELAAATNASRVLEVGHYLGLSTAVLLASLPPSCELVTVDHHQGDDWCPSTEFEEFQENVAPYLGDRVFTALCDDMRILRGMTGEFGFVFYDADHTATAVAEFWDHVTPLLADDCTLCFDDADWAEQATLRDLAAADGFRVVAGRDFYRGDGDKHDPDTYTLEVMCRG